MYRNGHIPSRVFDIEVFVAVPETFHYSDRNNSPHESETETSDAWNEVDQAELCSGTLDTMLTSPDCLDESERKHVFSLAPGEGSRPVSIFKDKHCEELAYPGISFGEAKADNKDRHVPVFYSDICKSELRRSDRRDAKCIENIFFKVKKLQMKILLGKCQAALRKHKTKGKTITAGHLKKSGGLHQLINADEGYRFLRALRGSPPYFEKAKKDLFAMIRKLGPATIISTQYLVILM